jgi:hypothetical protein
MRWTTGIWKVEASQTRPSTIDHSHLRLTLKVEASQLTLTQHSDGSGPTPGR